MNEPSLDFTSYGRINRVELIDYRPDSDTRGRVVSLYDVVNTVVSFQDDGRTLKVFVS